MAPKFPFQNMGMWQIGPQLFLVHSLLERGVFYTFGSVWNSMVCVGGYVLSRSFRCVTLIWKCLAVFHNHGLFKVCFGFFSFVWFSRNDVYTPPHLPSTILFVFRLLFLCIYSCFIPHFSIVWSCTVRSSKTDGQVCVRACVRAMPLQFIRGFAHLDVSFTLSSTSCTCFSVFLCGLAPPALLCFCLCLCLLSLLFLYDVYLTGWAADPFPFVLIGLSLHTMLADWLASGDVMRSWLAVYNLSMTSFDFVALCLIDKSAA